MASRSAPSQRQEASSTTNTPLLVRKRNEELSGRTAIEFKKAKTAEITTAENHGNKNNAGRCVNVGSRYEKLGRIGEGTYGIVYQARDKKTQQLVALKRCIPHHQSSDGFPLTTLREICTLRTLSVHPHIVTLHHVAVSSSGVFLVFEYCQHDLAVLVDEHYLAHRKSPFREAEVKRLVLQLLSALEFMHRRCYLHRDIKLSNILYNSNGELRLADFGLSRKYLRRPRQHGDSSTDDDVQPLTGNVVSLWYRPPEIVMGSNVYDEGVDNWGVGCVMAELLTGEPLVDGKNEIDQIKKIFYVLGPPTLKDWPELKNMPLIRDGSLELPRPLQPLQLVGKSLLDRFSHLSVAGLTLLQNLLAYDYHKRATASEALESSYFKQAPMATETRHMPRFPPKRGK